ncbi:PilN domain-containing protein [Vibrio sp. LaRot3]|uniref:PilN domain-containing protein n=1 Tax=Vibrio sp. LaRot3 TaxID=2998829 RepID=UPI0022CDED5F|nr:PilN domain-containing protein [Vibrio sp. LaRot3]MDA0149451.1 PilN domain-containing protein [Vibrio sp. LaRot3]
MLHNVNLLPWREQQRKAHQQRFFGLVVLTLLVTFFIQWSFGFYVDRQKVAQQQRLDFLNRHIVQLDKQLVELNRIEKEHQSLLTRLQVVEELQEQRNKTTQFMNLMPQLIPEGVYIDKIKMNGHQIDMSGISDTTSRLATMLDKLENSAELSEVEMHSIIHDKPRFGQKYQTFSVSFYFTPNPSEVEEENHG